MSWHAILPPTGPGRRIAAFPGGRMRDCSPPPPSCRCPRAARAGPGRTRLEQDRDQGREGRRQRLHALRRGRLRGRQHRRLGRRRRDRAGGRPVRAARAQDRGGAQGRSATSRCASCSTRTSTATTPTATRSSASSPRSSPTTTSASACRRTTQFDDTPGTQGAAAGAAGDHLRPPGERPPERRGGPRPARPRRPHRRRHGRLLHEVERRPHGRRLLQRRCSRSSTWRAAAR